MSGHGTRRSGPILVVDDDPGQRRMLRGLLEDLGCEVRTADDGHAALQEIAAHPPALCLLDVRMPGLDGPSTLRLLRERGDLPPVVVMTAHADLDDAVDVLKLGALDYLRKPIDLASLEDLLDGVCGGRVVARAPADELPDLPPGLVAESPLIRDVLRELGRAARSEVPVLLLGETGTGKDVLAGLVHRWSPRADAGPFVPVNVAALPETLVESELFGVARGAYTGAGAARDGRFQAADGGTLFLDELGELALDLQPKLLRVVESRQVVRLGESNGRQIDFRLVSATHRDLERMVEEGSFRQDLYYRLAVLTVEIPPLRERPEDVLPLARRFLVEAGAGRKRLSPDAERVLLDAAWPGNVRELANAMKRAAVLSAGEVVLAEHLPPALRGRSSSGASVPAETMTSWAAPLADLEKTAILEALRRTGGNRSAAARQLGISRRKLLYRLKEYRSDERSGRD